MSACFCLNITIETTPNDFLKVTPESLGLSEEERSEKFFKQDIQKVGNLISISKVHSCLVRSKTVGAWVISRCINCECHTHAVHRQKGASLVLIYSKLLGLDSIKTIRSSHIFSRIYQIVVNPNDIGIEDKETYRYFPPNEVENALRSVRETMSEFIRKQSLAIEQNIRNYTDQQYECLNNWKDKAFKENESLIRVICKSFEAELALAKKQESLETSMTSSLSGTTKQTEIKHSGDLVSPLDSPTTSSRRHHKPKRSTPPQSTNSDELIFEFDSDDANSMPSTDVDDSDKDEEEKGISIPKSTRPQLNMAKSLPMNIPAMAIKGNRNAVEDSDDGSPIGPNVDIAASMKALAKSVHGEPVFGDLPRRRCNAQF